MKMRQCGGCEHYTLKEKCPRCGNETRDAHYKYVVVKKGEMSLVDRNYSKEQ